jgi:hypothetical protein
MFQQRNDGGVKVNSFMRQKDRAHWLGWVGKASLGPEERR